MFNMHLKIFICIHGEKNISVKEVHQIEMDRNDTGFEIFNDELKVWWQWKIA